MTGRILLVGISTRAMAESAARAGYTCFTIDRFGDIDQRALVHGVGLDPDLSVPWSATRAARLARQVRASAVAYGANLENHPAAVAEIARGRELLGADGRTLRRVRDPVALTAALRACGVPAPETLDGSGPRPRAPARRWLRKPRHGGGGCRVRDWRAGDPLGTDEVGQEFIPGIPGSAAFAADGRRAVLLGLTRQLIGDASFGVTGFRYCGSLLPLTQDPDSFATAVRGALRAGQAVVRMSGIRGVFGIDFVLNHRGVHVLEVNPRQTASMELIERRHGLSIFDTHVQACRGSLPEFDLARVRGSGRVIGKAVAFARVDLELGDTRTWLRSGIADVPRPGTTTPAGAPVCTVFASGADHEGCVRALRRLTGTLGIGGPSVTGPRREAR